MRKRNWLVEDNLVALYVALHEYKDLRFTLEDIKEIIPLKGFSMRIQNYIAIDTDGEKGLDAALYFRVLYTDPRGWNLRNDICHGISLPNHFGVQISDRIFHTLILLGQVRERKGQERGNK